jgi:hypothetical protein
MTPTEYRDYMADLAESEFLAEAAWERRYRALMQRHPDCRDPAHPGCPDCVEVIEEDA